MNKSKEIYFLIVAGLGSVSTIIASAIHIKGQLALMEPIMDIGRELPFLFERSVFQLLIPFLTGLLYVLLMIKLPQTPLRRVWDGVTAGILVGVITGLMQGLFVMSRTPEVPVIILFAFGGMFFMTDLMIAVVMSGLGGLIIVFFALSITPTTHTDVVTPAKPVGLLEVWVWYALGPLLLNLVLSTAVILILINLFGLTGLPILPLLILAVFISYFYLTRKLEKRGKKIPAYWVLSGAVLGVMISWGASFFICMMSYVFYGCDLSAVFTAPGLLAYSIAHITAVLAFLAAKSNILPTRLGKWI